MLALKFLQPLVPMLHVDGGSLPVSFFYDLLFPLSPHYLLANGKMKDLESRRPPFKVGLVGVFSIVKCVMVAILLIEKSSLKCLA